MIQIKIIYTIIFILGFNLVINSNIEFSYSHNLKLNSGGSGIDSKLQIP